jgi:NAD(P)-dependent dehydrogenase (short-subunit alcohol dehydrogenase family)
MFNKNHAVHRGAVVVTGASRGIGEACALELSKLGFTVFAGVRKLADGDCLKRKACGLIEPVILDVTSSESIAFAVDKVTGVVGEDGLSGLVNNAGIAVAGPLELLPIEELRRQFEVNVVGQMAVTQAFLPLLRKGKGRIINMGSKEGRMAMPLVGPYCGSKFAMEALTDALRMELKPWGIGVSIIEPGVIATPILKNSISAAENAMKEVPEQRRKLYDQAIATGLKASEGIVKAAIPVEAVVKSVVHALTSKRPKIRYVVGLDAHIVSICCRLIPDRVLDWVLIRGMGLQGT